MEAERGVVVGQDGVGGPRLRDVPRPFDFAWPQPSKAQQATFSISPVATQNAAAATDNNPATDYVNLAGRYSGIIATATPATRWRIRTGALIGAIHIGGFFAAALLKPLAGAEYDADGRVLLGFIPPAALHLSISASLLAAGVFLCSKKGEAA